MKTTVNFSDFVDAFRAYDRFDDFGYDALKVIFEYLEEYEDSCGAEVELDVIAICCDFDVSCWEDIADNYRIDLDGCEDDDEKEAAVLEYLENNTMVLGQCKDGIVYQVF